MTLAEAQADLATYIAMRDRILTAGQSLGASGRTVNMPDLKTVEAKISELRGIIEIKQGGVNHATPVFKGYR